MGLPEILIQHFCAVAVDYQNGIFSGEDNVIVELTGKAPMTVQEFVPSEQNADDGSLERYRRTTVSITNNVGLWRAP